MVVFSAYLCFNPFTPDSAGLIHFANYKLGKIGLKNKQHHSKVLLNSFPMNGHTEQRIKVKKLYITQGFTLGVDGLNCII